MTFPDVFLSEYLRLAEKQITQKKIKIETIKKSPREGSKKQDANK